MNGREVIICIGVILITTIVLYFIFINQDKKEENLEIFSVQIINVEPMNNLDFEKQECLMCKQGYYLNQNGEKVCGNYDCTPGGNCNGGSLKINFKIDTNIYSNKLNYYYAVNGVRYPSDDDTYHSANSGLNVVTYAWRNYSSITNSQLYLLCVHQLNEKEICSDAYIYNNPC